MSKTRYKKQWRIPSSSDKGKFYTVSLTMNDEYICHCWPFLRNRKECTHILLARSGSFENIEPASEEECGNALLKQYAEKGYRYLVWFNADMYSWEKKSLETIKRDPDFEDVKTFTSIGRRIVVVKEKPQVYQNEIAAFTREIGNYDFRRVKDKAKAKAELRKRFFNLSQHIIYNSSGVVNPNLPEGSVYTTGTYGRQLHRIEMQYKWLR